MLNCSQLLTVTTSPTISGFSCFTAFVIMLMKRPLELCSIGLPTRVLSISSPTLGVVCVCVCLYGGRAVSPSLGACLLETSENEIDERTSSLRPGRGREVLLAQCREGRATDVLFGSHVLSGYLLHIGPGYGGGRITHSHLGVPERPQSFSEC